MTEGKKEDDYRSIRDDLDEPWGRDSPGKGLVKKCITYGQDWEQVG